MKNEEINNNPNLPEEIADDAYEADMYEADMLEDPDETPDDDETLLDVSFDAQSAAVVEQPIDGTYEPCPFCGNSARADVGFDENGDSFDYVICTDCGASTDGFYACSDGSSGKEAAEDAWNHRYREISGIWIRFDDHDEDGNVFECSKCGYMQILFEGTPFDNDWHYCPQCGSYLKYNPTVEELTAMQERKAILTDED